MKTLTVGNQTLTLNGNAAAAIELATTRETDFVSFPVTVIQNIRHPKWLVPVALAFIRDKSARPSPDDFAETLDQDCLHQLEEAVRDEILSFFQKDDRDYIQNLLQLEAEDRTKAQQESLKQLRQDAEPTGTTSGNSPESSAPTPETKPEADTPSELST